jgi:hypothetical protein
MNEDDGLGMDGSKTGYSLMNCRRYGMLSTTHSFQGDCFFDARLLRRPELKITLY